MVPGRPGVSFICTIAWRKILTCGNLIKRDYKLVGWCSGAVCVGLHSCYDVLRFFCFFVLDFGNSMGVIKKGP